MNLDERNYYEILGLDRKADTADIEAAYQDMRALYAPGGSQADPDIDAHVRRAYEVLHNPERRKLYDGLLAEVRLPIVTGIQISKQQLPIVDEPQMLYLLVELRPRDAEEQEVLPLNICLVLDRSTSMRGDRLQRTKQAVDILLSKLSPGDNLSVVAFSDRAEVVLPPRPVAEHKNAQGRIAGIEAFGGTEIFQGLVGGVRQLRTASLTDYNNQLILLTDGRTYGDEVNCLRFAKEVAAQGISIHAFGIGTDWDDDFLDALVEPSGGLVEYIDSPQKIVSALQIRLRALGETHARHVSLLADWPKSVELRESFRLTPHAQPLNRNDDQIALGDIEGGAPLSFVLAYTVQPQPIATRIRIPLQFTAEVPAIGKQTFREQIELSVVADPPPTDLPEEVIRAVHLLTLYYLHERAWQDVESGNTSLAVKRLRHLSTRLLEVGESDLALQADSEARQLLQTGDLSSSGHKRLKYGTRELTRKKIQLKWHE